jgi:tRNA pseudouridine13 synthase
MSDLPRIREFPEDFVVDEVPLYAPCGSGEHTYVRVEKRLRTTEEIARLLARVADVRPRDVGYAGRKDRNAVTRQWFSVPGLDPGKALALEFPGARVLEATRHRNKLRTGHLEANRFELLVRGVSSELLQMAQARAATLATSGMPNRFGVQRFGRDGDNAKHGSALLRGEPLRGVGDRRARRFLLSALQSAVFNDVLAERPIGLDVVELGDVAMLHSSGGMFLVEDLERETPRVEAFEISPTGPIFGTRMLVAAGAVLARETSVLERWELRDLSTLQPPPGIRLRGARRPLRARLADLSLSATGSDSLSIEVTLPPGSYATVLLEELLGDFDDRPVPAVS